MNWKETFEFAENLMMQEVMNNIQDDIDEYGSEYYGDIKTFDTVKFSSDSHYNDETTKLIVSDMTLYLNGEELDLSDSDYYDLINEMSDRYPRLIYCCDKLFVRENGQKVSDSFDCENVAHIVNQYKELQNLAKVKLQEYAISNQQDWYGVHDISFDESYVYGSVEVQAGFSTAIKNYKMPIEFLGLS
jgi:hypothetical protein